MTEEIFIKNNVDSWKALETYTTNNLINNKDKRTYKRKKNEIDNLLNLYSIILDNLSYVKTNFPGSDLYNYLNDLALKAHNIIYLREKTKKQSIKDFFRINFKEKFHENKYFILVSFLTFVVGAVCAYFLVMYNFNNIYVFLPKEALESVNVNGPDSVNNSIMSSTIMTNNIKVAFIAFALGLVLCIGTFFILFMNGALLGALLAYVQINHLSMLKFISLLTPHGVIELLAIFISGGTGMMIGYSFLSPGKYKRLDALKLKAKDSMYLMLGIVIMLVIAGLIEGFITPMKISPWLKIFIGITTGVLLLAYFIPNQKTHIDDFKSK